MLEPLLHENQLQSTKPEIEQVEKEKHEYKLLGTYLRKRGLRLYSYNSTRDELIEMDISKKDVVQIIPDENGNLSTKDSAYEEVQVDSRNIHFECLNLKNAKKRVLKYKDRTIKELCNLREKGEIKFW